MRSGNWSKVLCLWMFVASVGVSSAVFAEDDGASLEWSSTLIGRANPQGLISANRLTVKHRLYDSDSAVLANNFVALSLQPWVSPAWARPGVRWEVQPASVLNLSATYEYIGFFGTFDSLQSFDSPEDDYSTTRLEERADEGLNSESIVHQLTFAGLLQAKVGPIAIRNTAKLIYVNFDREQDFIYDPTLDIVLQKGRWTLENDADLLFVSDFGLIAGVRYTVTHSYYSDRFENLNQMQRLGPLVTYKFYDQPGEALSEVTGIFLANWWLKHRYRTGEEVSQAIPMLAFGVRLSGQLF